MKICSVNSYHNNQFAMRKIKCVEPKNQSVQFRNTPTFKGGNGAALGIVGGFLAGAGLTALTIATGGLAGIVAVAGATATTVAGGAACTHVGGIVGHVIEEYNNKH